MLKCLNCAALNVIYLFLSLIRLGDFFRKFSSQNVMVSLSNNFCSIQINEKWQWQRDSTHKHKNTHFLNASRTIVTMTTILIKHHNGVNGGWVDGKEKSAFMALSSQVIIYIITLWYTGPITLVTRRKKVTKPNSQ